MANWDFVLPYSLEAKVWFVQRDLCVPPVLPNNRAPTTADIKWALELHSDLSLIFPQFKDEFYVPEQENERLRICIRGFDWDNEHAIPENGCFSMRSQPESGFAVLVTLCQRCGQLLMWPDTGACLLYSTLTTTQKEFLSFGLLLIAVGKMDGVSSLR